MNEDGQRYELTKRDYAKNNALLWGARLAPAWVSLPLPIVFLVLYFLFGTTTSAAALYIFLSLLSLGVGFAVGILVMILLFIYRNSWLKTMRERLAVDGIKTHEVEWFKNELTSAERQALKEIEGSNRLLAEAYRETLASRLTATRILKSTKQELLLVQRRQNKLKYLKTGNAETLAKELEGDRERMEKVRREADELMAEAQTRLEQIEAAARRGTSLAGNEAALELLTARTSELPLALEAAKIEDEIRREIDSQPSLVGASLPSSVASQTTFPRKMCPVCKQIYSDDSLSFCLGDGAQLVPYKEEQPK